MLKLHIHLTMNHAACIRNRFFSFKGLHQTPERIHWASVLLSNQQRSQLKGKRRPKDWREFMRKSWKRNSTQVLPKLKYHELSGGAKQRHPSQQIISSPEDSTNGAYQIATLEHVRQVMDCYGMFEIRPFADIRSNKNVQQKSNLTLTTSTPIQRLPCTHGSPIRSELLRSSSFWADASWFLALGNWAPTKSEWWWN